MTKFGIYLIENTVSPLFYIGQSQDVHGRWRQHKYVLSSNTRRANKRLRHSWLKHGESAFKLSILELCDVSALTDREVFWLGKYRERYPGMVANSAGPVDNPMRGGKHTNEAIRKMSAAQAGIGKTPAHRAKIGIAHAGRIKSPAECAAISRSKTGIPNTNWIGVGNPVHSPSFKEKFTGDGNPAKRLDVRAKMSANSALKRGVIDIATGKTWETMSACAKELGVSVAAVHAAATKKNPSVKGRVLDRWFNAMLHRAAMRLAGA